MKKLYMCTIMGSSARDCVLIILFQLYACKTGLFEGNLFWMGQYYPFPSSPSLNLHIEEKKKKSNLILIIQSKIITSQKTADIKTSK